VCHFGTHSAHVKSENGLPCADDRADRRAAEDQTADSHVRTCLSGGFGALAALRSRVADRAAWRRDSSRAGAGDQVGAAIDWRTRILSHDHTVR